jgi:hypothetical protein
VMSFRSRTIRSLDNGRQELLQPRRVLDVEHSAQDENARASLCGLVDSKGHPACSARPTRDRHRTR